jgi:hypothetical protein
MDHRPFGDLRRFQMERQRTWRLTLAEAMSIIAVIAITFACMPELQASLIAAGLVISAAVDGCT